MLRPGSAPMGHQFGAVPITDLGTELGRSVFAAADLAHRQHDMRVRPCQSVGADVPMDIEVGDHAALDEPVSDEVAGQLDPLPLGHLPRATETSFASTLRYGGERDGAGGGITGRAWG